MKEIEALVKAAANIGFTSIVHLSGYLGKLIDSDEEVENFEKVKRYLWLNEFKLWLIRERQIHVFVYPLIFTHGDEPVKQEKDEIVYGYNVIAEGIPVAKNQKDLYTDVTKSLFEGLKEAIKLF